MPSVKKTWVVFAVLAWISGAVIRAELVQLNPIKDNTLYEKSDSLSNAVGIGVFAGRTGDGHIVRGVMAFDLRSIPPGSTIQAVSLTLRQTNSNNNTPLARTVSLYRLAKNWGEGTSAASLGGGGGGGGGPATAGDATWLHTFFNTELWENPGGDFAAQASGSIEVSGNGDYVWRSAGMMTDVQHWVDNRESNFGWLLRGDENAVGAAKRFGSRESDSSPVLLVQFTPLHNGKELSHAVYFPQFANGEGLSSRISLLNPDAENRVFARVVIRADDGRPFAVVLNGSNVPDGIVETEIPPGGVRVFETNAVGVLKAGSVTVSSDAPVGGVIVFGGAFGAEGIPAGGELIRGFAGPVQTRGVEIRTGVAVQNLSGDRATVKLEIVDSEGAVLATTQVDIPALGKLARFVDEMEWDKAVDFSDFSGSVRTGPGIGLAAVMIQNRLVGGIFQLATVQVLAR